MNPAGKMRLTRRDMLRLSAGGAGMFLLGASGLAVPRGIAGEAADLNPVYFEAFPTSPLILSPFNDALPVPKALAPVDPLSLDGGAPEKYRQDCFGVGKAGSAAYQSKYGQTLGAHQLWPGEGPTAGLVDPTPNVYDIKLQVAGHSFTSSS